MKRIVYLAASIIVSALMTVTCVSINNEKVEEHLYSITAGIGDDQQTKTGVIDGGTKVYWETNESIMVFHNGSSCRCNSKNSEWDTSANFYTAFDMRSWLGNGETTEVPIFGLYPYDENAIADNTSIHATLKPVQTSRAGSFSKDTHLSVGQSNNLTMNFFAVGGGARFTVASEGIEKIIFEGNNGETLAGKVKIVFADGRPKIESVSDGSKTITVTPEGSSSFVPGKWYYIEAIPVALEKGFSIMMFKGSKYAKRISTKPATIVRANYGSISNIDEGLAFNDFDIELTVDPAGLYVDCGASEYYASIYSNKEWTATSSASWLKVTPNGTGDSKIKVSWDANEDEANERKGTIVVSVEGKSKTFSVLQKKKTYGYLYSNCKNLSTTNIGDGTYVNISEGVFPYDFSKVDIDNDGDNVILLTAYGLGGSMGRMCDLDDDILVDYLITFWYPTGAEIISLEEYDELGNRWVNRTNIVDTNSNFSIGGVNYTRGIVTSLTCFPGKYHIRLTFNKGITK